MIALIILVGLAVLILGGGAGYLTILTEYQRDVIDWCDEREAVMREVFQAARAIEHHQYRADPLPEEAGYNQRLKQGIYSNGVLLNHQTLISMVMEEQDQRGLLLVAMDHVALWELEHPVPPKPWLIEKLHHGH